MEVEESKVQFYNTKKVLEDIIGHGHKNYKNCPGVEYAPKKDKKAQQPGGGSRGREGEAKEGRGGRGGNCSAWRGEEDEGGGGERGRKD